jgi:hypothetical protein
MSKADGQIIAMRFTEKITSNVEAILSSETSQIVNATVTTKNYYTTGYEASKLVDGSTSTAWLGSSSVNWIKIKYQIAKLVTGFKWYLSSTGQTPTTFTVSGSNDDISYTQITDVLNGTDTTGWQEYAFENSTRYQYYRIDILTAVSSLIRIAELQMTLSYGNEKAFNLSGSEYNYVPEGELIAGDYQIEAVSSDLEDEYLIRLTFGTFRRFLNVVGQLTLSYDSSKGNLSGLGGPVASFSVSFSPEDLVSKPNVNDPENLEIVLISSTGVLTKVTYYSTSNEENIELANISATGILTNIDDL